MFNYRHIGSKIRRHLLNAVFAIAMLVSVVLSAQATSVEFDYNNAFSGTAPSGTSPWLTAIFSDTSADTVTLTMSGVGLAGSEYVKGWYFNLDTVSPGSLTIAELTQTGTFQAPTVNTGADSYKADGSGKYDLLFSFATANDAGQRFMSGDSITFTITSSGLDALDFSALDFETLCSASAGMGPFYSAAQVCGISNGQYGWIDPTIITVTKNGGENEVPDTTATIILLGIGMLIVEGGRRKLPVFQRQ